MVSDVKAANPISEEDSNRQFEGKHWLLSALSSWLFTISGATNIGVLGTVSANILMAMKKEQPLFRSADPQQEPLFGNRKYNMVALGMVAFGGACMYISNLLETRKTMLEWDFGGGKVARKTALAQRAQQAHAPGEEVVSPALSAEIASPLRRDGKSWAEATEKSKDMQRSRA